MNRGLYLWGASDLKDLNIDALFRICEEYKISFLLVSVNDLLLEEQTTLSRFIQKLHGKNISVGALNGQDGDTVLPRKQENPLRRLEKLISYNLSVRPENQFDTVHFDIEPHSHPELKKLKKTDRVKYEKELKKRLHFQIELYEKLRRAARGRILLGADFPHWYQFEENTEQKEFPVFHHNCWKPASQHIMDIMDYSCVMAYGNTTQKCIRFAEDHIHYAQQSNQHIFISMNCNDGKQKNCPTDSSLFQEGKHLFHDAIESMELEFMHVPAFKGVMIHDYRSFSNLQQPDNGQ